MKELYNAPEVEIVKFAPVENIADSNEASPGYDLPWQGETDIDGVG